MSDSIENGGHMVGPSAGTEADTPVLPPLEELFGNDAQVGSEPGLSEQELDDMFHAMFDVAVDPNTEMPEGDLIPSLDSFPEESPADEASHEVDLADMDDSTSLEGDATSVEDHPSDASGEDLEGEAHDDPFTDPVDTIDNSEPASAYSREDYGNEGYGNEDFGDEGLGDGEFGDGDFGGEDFGDDLTDLGGM